MYAGFSTYDTVSITNKKSTSQLYAPILVPQEHTFLWLLKITKYLSWISSSDFHFTDEETVASRESK